MRAGHAHRTTAGIARRHAVRHYLAIAAVLVPHAELRRVGWRAAIHMGLNTVEHHWQIVRMHQAQIFAGARANLLERVTQHGGKARRKLRAARHQIELPQAHVGAPGR